jgi:nitrogen fixation/metabolism regulation signal transduction histidine kinase
VQQNHETDRQLVELRDELEARRQARDAMRRRLNALEEQAAHMGRDTPAHITTEIGELVEKRRVLDGTIGEIEKRIARLELSPQSAIEVLPRGESTYDIKLAPVVIDSRLQAVERMLIMLDDRGSRMEGMLGGLERVLERLAGDVTAKAEIDHEWREAERSARSTGQRDYRVIFAIVALILLLLAIGVILIAIRVY